jgi:GNAT superfamily N-acetyltransferase
MIEVRPIEKKDIPLIHEIASEMWGSNIVAAHLELYDVDDLPGFAAFINGDIVGFLHFKIKGDSCEILTLASLREGKGAGSVLINAIEHLARSKSCTLLHLVTTNDNLHALGFYQRRGFHLSQLYPGRVEFERKLKPSIPEIGDGGIPIRDEIRLEKSLTRVDENGDSA